MIKHKTVNAYSNYNCRCQPCKDSWAEYWRNKNKTKEAKTTIKNHKSKRYQLSKSVINWLKGAPCFDCGIKYPPYVMDFDHRDRTNKKFNISENLYSNSLKMMLEEIAKCDVVCSNCHRIRTWG